MKPPAVNRRLLLLVPLARAAEGRTPPVLQPGPHLFVADFLIEQSSHLTRRVNSPKRDLAQPVVTGQEDQNWQPYVSVVRDPTTRRFRMWHDRPTPGKGSHLGYLESDDGVRWLRPHRVLADPAQIIFGASVLDEGSGGKAPEDRYPFLWWTSGLWLAHSADGLRWQKDQPRPVLTGTSDISSLARDPIRNRYLAVFGMPSPPADGYQGKTPNTRASSPAAARADASRTGEGAISAPVS